MVGPHCEVAVKRKRNKKAERMERVSTIIVVIANNENVLVSVNLDRQKANTLNIKKSRRRFNKE